MISIPEKYAGDPRVDGVIGRMKDYGCMESALELSEPQQQRLFSMAYRNLNDPVQKGLFLAGYGAIRNSGLVSDNGGCVYLGIRGSVARGEADINEDVDIFAMSSDKSATVQRLREPCREEGMKLKEKLPYLKRDGPGLVVPVVYDSHYLGQFIENPVVVDIAEPDDYQSDAQLNRINRFQTYVKTMAEAVINDPNADPIEFLHRMVEHGGNPRYKMFLKPKVCGHNLIATAARLQGYHVIGDVPKNRINDVRDIFLKGLLMEEGVY